MRAVEVNLGPVQETLLIPLLGRAEATEAGRGLIEDPVAVELVRRLDYDFSKWSGKPSVRGTSVRARMFDDQVRGFLQTHPGGTVIEIGAGLNSRFERLDNGQARWVEIDLPDAMALRRQFFDAHERRTMLAASVLEPDWFETVREQPGPYCFVSEAVLIYLEDYDVRRTICQLALAFPGATLIMDTVSSRLVERQRTNDAMKELGEASWFRWKCDDPSSLRGEGAQLECTLTLADIDPQARPALSFAARSAIRWLPWLVRHLSRDYRIHRFRLG